MSIFRYLIIFFIVIIFILPNILIAQPSTLQFTLQSAIQYGLKKSPRIQEAEGEIKRFQGERLQKRWLQDPSVEIALEQIPIGKNFRSAEDKRFIISQSFPFPTKIFTQSALYSRLVDRAEYNFSAIKLEVTTGIKISYYNVLFWKAQIQLAQDIVKLAKDFLDKARLRYETGEASYLEFLRARVEAAQAEQRFAEVQTQFQNAKNQLKLVMGFDEINDVTLMDSLQFTPIEPSKEKFLNEAIILKHPVYLSIQQQLAAARFQKRLAQQSYLPDINVSSFKQKEDGNSKFYGVFLGLTFPLWFFSNQRGQVNSARGELQQIEAAAVQQKLILQTEIKNLYNLVLTKKAVVSAFKASIEPLAEEGFRVARLSYQEGEIGYIEFLEAQRSFIETQSRYLEALLDYNITLAKFEQAAGIPITY